MRNIGIVIVSTVMLGCAATKSTQDLVAEYSTLSYDDALLVLQQTSCIDGRCVGPRCSEGRFYALSVNLLPKINDRRVEELLVHTNPSCRVMALLWLALSSDSTQRARLEDFSSDSAIVEVLEFGCMVSPSSIAQIAKQLSQNPLMFGNGPDENPYGNVSLNKMVRRAP